MLARVWAKCTPYNGIAFRHTLTYRVHLIFVQVSAFDDPFYVLEFKFAMGSGAFHLVDPSNFRRYKPIDIHIWICTVLTSTYKRAHMQPATYLPKKHKWWIKHWWKSLFQKRIHDLLSQVPGVRIRRTRAVHSMTLERWALRFRPCIQCQASSELSHILFRFVSIVDRSTPF